MLRWQKTFFDYKATASKRMQSPSRTSSAQPSRLPGRWAERNAGQEVWDATSTGSAVWDRHVSADESMRSTVYAPRFYTVDVRILQQVVTVLWCVCCYLRCQKKEMW